MNCEICKTEKPLNLLTISKSWVCPICAEKPLDGTMPLKSALEQLYHDCKQVSETVKLLYISDLENNLYKINEHFAENVNWDAPMCTVTLARADTYDLLPGPYKHIFIDNDIIDKDLLLLNLPMDKDPIVYEVEPIKQRVKIPLTSKSE